MPPLSRNRSQRGSLVCLTLGLVAWGLARDARAEEPPRPAWVSMTLEEARKRALEHSSQLVQAAGAVRTAEAADRRAFGAYLPRLNADASSSVGDSSRPSALPGESGPDDSYSVGLSAAWDVFTGFRRRAERQQAQADIQTAQARLVEQRFGVAFQTGRAFFDGLRAEELMTVARSRIERAQEGVSAAERRLAVGSATRSDLLRAQLELNTAREALLLRESERYNAALLLGQLAGVEGPVDPSSADPVEPQPLSEQGEALVAALVSGAPSVRAAEAFLLSAEAGIGVARSQYYPSVRLSAGTDWFNDAPVPGGSTVGWSVQLGVSYPIFDGFVRDEGQVRARVQVDIAQSQLAETRRLVRAESERVLGLLKLLEERLALSRQAVQVAQEDLRVQQERYRLGASTILDLLASQTALVEAENNLVGLRFDYQLARSELEAIAGRPL
jgi:outer membrane protein